MLSSSLEDFQFCLLEYPSLDFWGTESDRQSLIYQPRSWHLWNDDEKPALFCFPITLNSALILSTKHLQCQPWAHNTDCQQKCHWYFPCPYPSVLLLGSPIDLVLSFPQSHSFHMSIAFVLPMPFIYEQKSKSLMTTENYLRECLSKSWVFCMFLLSYLSLNGPEKAWSPWSSFFQLWGLLVKLTELF